MLTIFLSACGSSDPADPGSSLTPRTISITSSLPLTVGGSANVSAALSAGTGTITYVSNTTEVATVDAQGVVTAVSAGTAVITASVAADNTFAAASAQAQVSVTLNPRNISLTTSTLSLATGSTANVGATLSTSTASILYESSSPSIATVDAQGVVTAVGAGAAVITASVAADNTFASASEQVQVSVTRISRTIASLTTSSVSLVARSTADVSATLSTSTASINYRSSSESVATVDGQGVVTAVGAGTAVVTASVAEDSVFTAASTQAQVIVSRISRAIASLTSSSVFFAAGSTADVSATLSASTASINYRSSSSSIVSVSSQGIVTGVAPGTVTITASVDEDSVFTAASTQAQVVVAPALTFERSEYRIGVGESTAARAAGATAYASLSAVIATIDGVSGTLTGVAPGVIGISATAPGRSAGVATVVVNNRPVGNIDYASFANGYRVSTDTTEYAEGLNRFRVTQLLGSEFSAATLILNTTDNINQRQAVGTQFTHAAVLPAGSSAGLSVEVSTNGSVVFDYTSATHLVIQMGNGRASAGADSSTAGDTHSTFTVRVLGFTGSAQQQCEFKVGISENTRPDGSGSASGSQFGLETYVLPFTNCSGSAAASVLAGVRGVAVTVVGGDDPVADASLLTQTLLTIGNIGFLGITGTPDTERNQLFSSGYTPQDDTLSRFAGTNANAGVFEFGITNNANVNQGVSPFNTTSQIQVRQSVANQFRVNNGLPDGVAFGLRVQAPNAGRVLVSSDSNLVIQTGNGQTDAMSHTTFTIRVTGGIQNPDNSAWEHDCEVDLDVSNSQNISANPGSNVTGLQTYTIPLRSFTTCRAGNLEGVIFNGVSEVVVSVVGGKNPIADAAQGDVNTLINVGWISFTR